MRAVVPLKSPCAAKSRLCHILNPGERTSLFFGMARHVIETLQMTPGITGVSVVTSSDTVDEFAVCCGADTIRQSDDEGTAAAFAAAVKCLRREDCDQLLMISGDLPLLTTQAIGQMIAAAETGADVVIAPDRAGTGTNALLCSPPTIVAPQFGVDSFRRHCDAVHGIRASLIVVTTPALAFDVDVAEDLDHLRYRFHETNGEYDFLPVNWHYVGDSTISLKLARRSW